MEQFSDHDQPVNDIESLISRGVSADPDNRRRHSRHVFKVIATMFEVDSYGIPSEGQACEAVDVSRSGLGLRTRRMVHNGRRLIIKLQLGEREIKILYGVVRFSKYNQRGRYHVGVELEHMPETADFSQWLREHGRP